LILTVVNRAKRQAKIKGAWLCVEGKGFMDSLRQGFGPHFCPAPADGYEDETLIVELFRQSPPNSPEGYVLDRDDVGRFFLPTCSPALAAFLDAPPDNISIRAVFFDDS